MTDQQPEKQAIENDDVEAHRAALEGPETDDDVEGHAHVQVQPRRDADNQGNQF